MEDIRYLQRFENFEKSFLLLRASLEVAEPSLLEKAGVIQFFETSFETSFELAWKLLEALYVKFKDKICLD